MQIEMMDRSRSQHVYSVVLESQAERDWSEGRLITAVDRRGNLTNDQWELIASGAEHPGHFGGNVRRVDEDFENPEHRRCIVTVYVD